MPKAGHSDSVLTYLVFLLNHDCFILKICKKKSKPSNSSRSSFRVVINPRNHDILSDHLATREC